MLRDGVQIQEIGMGWYQWQLFTVVGFGWANDNMWPIVTSLICKFVDFTPKDFLLTLFKSPLLPTSSSRTGLRS
jgi:hypothetical protein